MVTLPIIGLVLALLGLGWLIGVIFQEGGVLWGVVVLIVPLLALVYVAMNWGESVKSPVLVLAGGVALFGIGTYLG